MAAKKIKRLESECHAHYMREIFSLDETINLRRENALLRKQLERK